MTNFRPSYPHFLLSTLIGLAGVRALFENKMLLAMGIILISSAYGSGLWLIVDRYVEYWKEVNKFASLHPDELWAYLKLPKPSQTSRVMVQTNDDVKYPSYDTRELNVSRETMREIALTLASGVHEFSERKYEKAAGSLTKARKLQKEFSAAGYIRRSKKGGSYDFTPLGKRKIYSYLRESSPPLSDMELRPNDA